MKPHRIRLSVCLLLAVMISASYLHAADLGNIIRILQVCVGLSPTLQAGDDANGDGKVSLEDAVLILQVIAGLRDDEAWKYNLGTINLGTPITYSGTGIAVSGTTVTITAGGDYTVTGTLADGMIVVNTTEKAKLRLGGMSLANKSGPAIFVSNADKAFITLVENTTNYLSDGSSYATTEAKGALFSNDTLEIKGNGMLYVSGNYKHAIAGDDDIIIENGTIIIEKSVKDGIHAKDNVTITGGKIAITSSSDGIESEGDIVMNDGTVVISAGGDGLVAATGLTITGGIVVAAGTANTSPGDTSAQPSVLLGSGAADSIIRIEQSGTEILTFRTAKSYQNMLFTSPNLVLGKTYSVLTGGSVSGGTNFYGLYTGAAYTGGTQSASFTIDSVVTTAK